jgi:hypothetical protein
MSRSVVLARGRRAAERAMTDTCSIRRAVGETNDPFSGEVTPGWEPVYTGKCRLQQTNSARADQHEIGEAYILLQQLEVQLPMSATDVQTGDEITLTASQTDMDNVGRVFRVRDLMVKTDATARRIQVTEATS